MATNDQPKFWAHFEKSADEVTQGTIRDLFDIKSDEPGWLPAGDDLHPCPGDFLLTALTTCQVSVLAQCLEKSRVEEYHIEADSAIANKRMDEIPEEMPENTGNRWEHVDVELTLEVPPEYEAQAERCAEVYDNGCVVGQSYRSGIDYTPTVTIETSD